MKVLDHGYVELIETWGSDERIIEAARMSTGKGFLGWGPKHAQDCEITTLACDCNDEDCIRCAHLSAVYTKTCTCVPQPGDEKLLAYLWKNNHATPFEMAGAILEIQAPIFVFREWHRHRTQSYNELSARYTPLPDVNYMPTVERLMMNAGGSNKQAGTIAGAAALEEEGARACQESLRNTYVETHARYVAALVSGIPKELARLHLPVGRYSRMRASANLRNWLAFLTLRMAPNAQWEIRQYANAVGELVKEKFPRTWGLFEEGRR